MKRAQSFEFNPNKKVSLPNEDQTNVNRKFSYGWIRRSAANVNERNTIIPVGPIVEEIPDYFNMTMQSLSLTFLTFAYSEMIDAAVLSTSSNLFHAILKFFTIISIAVALIAAFSSLKVSTETNVKSNASKIYSTLARFGSIAAAVACGMIICLFTAVSLYRTFHQKSF